MIFVVSRDEKSADYPSGAASPSSQRKSKISSIIPQKLMLIAFANRLKANTL
jgi:hypothetical protein